MHQVLQTPHAGTWFEVLRSVLGVPSAQDGGKPQRIQARFKRALHMIRRRAMLPEGVARTHADLRTLAVGSKVEGWITRTVPQG